MSDNLNQSIMTNQEILLLKLAEYKLQTGFIQSATDSLMKGRRRATNSQILVLEKDLDELGRVVEDLNDIAWPTLPPDPERAAQAELIAAYEDYIKLMDEELNEIVPIAYNHHWRSTRFDAGRIARARIAQAKEALHEI